MFLVMYLFTMTLQIFVPGFLGTQLTYEVNNKQINLFAFKSLLNTVVPGFGGVVIII